MLFKIVEHAGPAVLMVVARGLIEQLLVVEREQRAVAVGLQGDRHQRFTFRRRMPGPAEHQPLVRHHLAIDAADIVILTVFLAEADAVTPADPGVDVRLLRAWLDRRWREPARHSLRVGPRGVDFLGRRIETTFEGEARSIDEAGGAGGA